MSSVFMKIIKFSSYNISQMPSNYIKNNILNETYKETIGSVYVNIDVTSSLKKNHAAFFLLRIFCRVSREGFKYTVWIMFHCFGGLLHRDGFDWYAA